MDDLLAKCLLDEATPEEKRQVDEWTSSNAANKLYYDQFKKIWDASHQLAAVSAADENKAWEKFKNRVQGKHEGPSPVRKVSFSWKKMAVAAAVLIAVSLIGYQVFNNSDRPGEMLVEAKQSVLTDTLPDGSVVTLNKESSISYLSKFKNNTRKVTLKGEAFFSVAPDRTKPFVIDVNDVQVVVVGTSFNIKSNNGNTVVVVESGIVKVTRKGKTVELRAGEKIETGKIDSLMHKEEVTDKLYNYYRTKEFVCDDTPLWKLVQVLNEAYQANIVIVREDLKGLLLNTTFVNESLDQVLRVISLTFNIKVTKEEGKIILQ